MSYYTYDFDTNEPSSPPLQVSRQYNPYPFGEFIYNTAPSYEDSRLQAEVVSHTRMPDTSDDKGAYICQVSQLTGQGPGSPYASIRSEQAPGEFDLHAAIKDYVDQEGDRYASTFILSATRDNRGRERDGEETYVARVLAVVPGPTSSHPRDRQTADQAARYLASEFKDGDTLSYGCLYESHNSPTVPCGKCLQEKEKSLLKHIRGHEYRISNGTMPAKDLNLPAVALLDMDWQHFGQLTTVPVDEILQSLLPSNGGPNERGYQEGDAFTEF